MANDVEIVVGAQDKASAVLNDVAGNVAKLSTSFSALGPAVLGIGAAIGTAVAGFMSIRAAIDGVSASSEKIDALSDTARGLGATVGDLQAFQFAMAEAGNIDAATSIQALQKMQKVIGEVATGGNEAGENVFKQLGLDAEELSLQRPIDQFIEVRAALADIENVSERAAIAQKLLGKSAADLIPALISEQDEFEASMQAAADLGAAVSDEGAAGVAAMNDAIGRVSLGVEGLFNQLAVAIAPAVEAIATELAGWLPPIIDLAETYLPKIVDAFAYIADTVNLTGGKTWTQGIAEARAAAEEAGRENALQADAMAGLSGFQDLAAVKAAEAAQKEQDRLAKAAADKAKREQDAIIKKAEAEAKKIADLKEKEINDIKRRTIELEKGKEAAHAFALEVQGIDKATAAAIASMAAAVDAREKGKLEKDPLGATQGRLLTQGRPTDSLLKTATELLAEAKKLNQLQAAANRAAEEIYQEEKRRAPQWKVATVP